MKTNLKFLGLFAMCVMGLGAYAQAQKAEVRQAHQIESAQNQYEKIFDYYVEMCGVTQFSPKGVKAGGPYGHAVMYIKGACRDTSSEYPRLKFCGGQAGAGISLDSEYTNINWTAVDGREFMFSGDLPPDQPLTKEVHDAAINKAVDLHIFKNIRFAEFHNKEILPGESYEHFVARWSLGTGFGVTMARSAYCTRIPIQATVGPKNAMVKNLIGYLNKLNEKAYTKGFVYRWDSDNCTHLPYNAMAFLGMWEPKELGWDLPGDMFGKLSRAKDLAVPFNMVLEALQVGNNQGKAIDPLILSSGTHARKAFDKYGWIAAQPGVITEIMPVHSFQNTVFNTDAKPLLMDKVDEVLGVVKMPKFELSLHKFDKTLAAPEMTSLKSNFASWSRQYMQTSQMIQEASDRSSFTSEGHMIGSLYQYVEYQKSHVLSRVK